MTLDDDEDTDRTRVLERYGFPEGLIDALAQAGARHAEELDTLLSVFPKGRDCADAIVREEMCRARDALRRIAALVAAG